MSEPFQGGTLDLDKLVASKFNGKKLPRFVMNALKRFLHVDEINRCLVRGKVGVEFCTDVCEYLDLEIKVEGLENIPNDGTLYTFASNHPLGGIDGVAISGLIGSRFGDMRMLVNDFLMMLPGLRPLCVPINKVGSQSRNLPQMIAEAFASDKQLLIFPAGLCSRKIDGKIQDFEWTKTFITKSVASGRDIVPVRFFGQNSPRYYRVTKFFDMLKMKFNPAMLFLPDEMMRGRGGSYRIVFGEPIPYTTFDKSKTPAQWAQWVREQVYNIQ